jgi:Flp pilus assembly protein TadD
MLPPPSRATRAALVAFCAAALLACSETPEHALAEARRLQDEGKTEAAMRKVDGVLEAHPGLFEARLLKAVIVGTQAGREEEALGALRQLAQAEPRRTGVHRAMGTILARTSRFAPAVNQFEKELAIAPDDADTLTDLGIFYFKTGQMDQAEDRLRRATEHGGGNARAWRTLAEVSFRASRFEEGLTQQRRAVELAPDDADLLVSHARALGAYGHAADAKALLDAAVARGMKDAALPAEQARQAREGLDYEGAVAAYKRSLDLDPKRSGTLMELGKTYLLMGRRDEARAVFEGARDASPSDPYPWFYLGTMSADDGALDQAIADLRKSLDLDPVNPKAHYALAQALLRSGRADEARAEFARHAESLDFLRGNRASGTSTLD